MKRVVVKSDPFTLTCLETDDGFDIVVVDERESGEGVVFEGVADSIDDVVAVAGRVGMETDAVDREIAVRLEDEVDRPINPLADRFGGLSDDFGEDA